MHSNSINICRNKKSRTNCLFLSPANFAVILKIFTRNIIYFICPKMHNISKLTIPVSYSTATFFGVTHHPQGVSHFGQ